MSSSSSNGGTSSSGRRSRAGVGFEGPLPVRRRRGANEIWPEPFVEALATQVAVDASSGDRLSVAPALAHLFRVCSTWRAVSRSEMLWQRLTHHVWGRTRLIQDTWREEFIYHHRTARNFRTGRYAHHVLQFDPSDVEEPDGLVCRCLALNDNLLACGFADGTVRLFHLATLLCVSTIRPHPQDRFGRFSRAVSGIVLSDNRVVFATMDGDVHVSELVDSDGGIPPTPLARRAHVGDVVNDGALVDFSGCQRWWVGLYAGVPGRAFHIWDSGSEEIVFVGGSLTDPEAVMGWHALTELTEPLGRIRVTGRESAWVCTRWRVMVFDLRDQGVVLGERDHPHGLIVTACDAGSEAYLSVDSRGNATVRRVDTMQAVCSFRVGGASQQRRVVGCMNLLHALMCARSVIRVWEIQGGDYLYSFRERVGELIVMASSDRHVAASGTDNVIRLWDFGAQ